MSRPVIVRPLVVEALQNTRPRPGFSAELLRALQEAPALRFAVADARAMRVRRILMTSSVAGAVGVAGAALYTVARAARRKGSS